MVIAIDSLEATEYRYEKTLLMLVVVAGQGKNDVHTAQKNKKSAMTGDISRNVDKLSFKI